MTSPSETGMPYADLTVEEWEAMVKTRQREYETTTLVDRELDLDTPEVGNDLMAAAAVDLKARGILLADASQSELLEALVRVTS